MALFGLVKNFIQKIDEHVSAIVKISDFKGRKEDELIEEVEKAIQSFKDEVESGDILISAKISINEAKEKAMSADLFGFGNIPDISFEKIAGHKKAKTRLYRLITFKFPPILS